MIPTGRQIRMGLGALGMTQRAMARALKIRPETVGRAINGEASMSMMRRFKDFFEERGIIFRADNGTVWVGAPAE